MSTIKLDNADCFEWIKNVPNKSVDLVLIDPPYEISKDIDHAGGIPSMRVSYDFGEWDKNFIGLPELIKECYRVLKNQGTIICFYDIWKISYLKKYLEDAGFGVLRFIEWVKTNPVPFNSHANYLTNSREIALTACKGGSATFHSKYDNGIYNFPLNHEKDRFHPTQKPINLLEALITKHSNEGDLILDCFAGSASTAVAAYNLNRNFIGCEISEEYYTKAKERINKVLSIPKRHKLV